MLLGGGITCSGGPAQALQWHGGGGSEPVPALLSGLFPTLPWLLWRRVVALEERNLGGLEKPEGRSET